MSVTGVLPRLLGCSAPRGAEWYKMCSLAELEFLVLVEHAKKLLPSSRKREHHIALRRARVAADKAKKTAYLVIHETAPLDIIGVLKKWKHNPEGVPVAIRQELDGSLNYTDVNIWMWLKAVLPKKGYMALRQCLLDLFSKPSRWASLVQDQAYISLKGDTLRALVKL